MSNRKNNTKSKKTTNNSSDFNSFRMEALEPRLLMSATAAEWQAEFSTVESVVSTVDSNLSSNALSDDLNRDIAGLYTVDSDTGTSELAKLSDLVSSADVDQMDLDGVGTTIAGFVGEAVTALQTDTLDSLGEDADTKHDQAEAAKLDSSVSQTERDRLEALAVAAESAYTEAQSHPGDLVFSAAQILTKLGTQGTRTGNISSYTYSITKNGTADALNVDLQRVEYSYKSDLAADLGGPAGVDVTLTSLNVQKNGWFGDSIPGNVKTGLSLDLTLDGNILTVDDPDVELYGEAVFRQDTSNTEASYGLLGLTSVADSNDYITPDLTLGASISLSGSTSTVRDTLVADLNFTIPTSAAFDAASFGLSTSSTQVLSINTKLQQGNWTWSDTDIEVFDKVDMGQILGKLSELSQWLSANTSTSASNADPLLKETFGGLLDQNVSEFLQLSSMLDCVLKNPPTTLQGLYSLLDVPSAETPSDSDEIVPVTSSTNAAMTFETINGQLNLVIPFNLKITGISNAVSLAKALFEDLDFDGELDFDIQSNASLNLKSSADLSFSLLVPLTESAQATEDSTLADIGLVETETDLEGNSRDAMDLESILGSSTVLAAGFIPYGGSLTGDVKFNVTVKAATETTLSVEFNYGTTSTCTDVTDLVTVLTNNLSNSGISTIVDEDQGRYLLKCDYEFSLKCTTDDNGHTSYEKGFRELGLAGVSSQRAFVSNAAIAENSNLRKIKVSNTNGDVETNFQGSAEDCVSALNAVFATNGDFKGYVASEVNGYLIIVPPSGSSVSLSVTLASSSFAVAAKYVAFSNTLSIAHPSADMVISFVLDSVSTDVTVKKSDLQGTQNAADVASVIQREINKESSLKDNVVAEVRDGKIAFRTTSFDSTLSVSFDSATSATILGFSSSSGLNESSACLSLTLSKVDNVNPAIVTSVLVNIDLHDFFALRVTNGQSLTSVTIEEILTQIVTLCNTALSGSLALSSDTVGLTGQGAYTLESIKNLNGFTLASLLGLTGSRADGQNFKIKATLASAEDSIQFRSLNLSINHELTGSASLDAQYGSLGVVLAGGIGLKQTMTVSVAEGQLSSASTIATPNSISAALQTVAGTIDKPLALIESNDFVALVNNHIGATTLPNATDGDIVKAMDKISELVTLVRNTASAVDALAAYTPEAVSAVTSATGNMRSYAETLAGIVSSLSAAYSAVDQATTQTLAEAQVQLANAKAALASVNSILVNLAFAASDASTAFGLAKTTVNALISSTSTAANTERGKNTITSSYETVSGYSNTLTASLASGVLANSPVLGSFNVSLSDLNAGNQALGWSVNTALSQASLDKFKEYDIDTVLKTVSTVIEKQLIEKFLGEKDFLTSQDIPLLGKTLSEVLGIQQKLNDVLLEIKSNYPDTLQELSAQLLDKLGVSLKFSLDSDSLEASLYWNYSIVSKKIQLGSMNFGNSDFVFGGTLEAYLDASVTLQAQISMAYTSGSLVAKVCGAYSTDTNGVLHALPLVACNVSLVAKPLSGDLVLGYDGMSAPLLQVVSSSTEPSYLCLSASFVLGTTATAGAEITDFDMDSATMRIGGELHIQCAGMDLGTVILGVGDKNATTQQLFISTWTGTTDSTNPSAGVFNLITEEGTLAFPHFTILYPASINPSGTNQIVEDNLILDISSLDVSLSETSLFEKLRLVTDGLGDTIRRAQSGMTKEFLSSALRDIPFVGDSIINAADCLSDLDKSFVEPFRKFVNNAVGLDAEAVAKYLYTLLNKTGLLGTLDSCSTSSKETWAGKSFDSFYKGIQYSYENVNGIETAVWRIRLTGEYVLDADADFDLGFPGLGLRSEGGIKASLSWVFDFGFGISSTEGAFLLLSKGDNKTDTDWINGSDATAATGDDISIALKVIPTGDSSITGSLGFLQMKADIIKTGTTDFVKNGFELTLGVDLNDGVNDKSKDYDDDLTSDQNAASQISFSNLGSGLSVEASLVGDLNLVLDLTLGGGSSFPELTSTFVLDWSASVGNITGTVEKVAFTEIEFNAGSFIDNVLGPMVSRIQKILEPLQPLFDFLQMEIPVINKLPAGAVKITVLDLVKMYGQSQDMDLGMLDDIIALNNLAKSLTTVGGIGLSLPDLVLVDTVTQITDNQEKLARGTANTEGTNFLNGLVVNIDQYVKNLQNTFYKNINTTTYSDMMAKVQSLKGQAGAALSAFSTDASSSSSSGITTSGGGGGWSFPIIQDPMTEIMGLFFGRQATLVTYDMAPLEFNFEWTKSFAIVGPLCADVGFNFGVCIDLEFGYDTLGLANWMESDFKDSWALLDGFYINDLDSTNTKDVSEIIFHSGIIAGASVAGRAGINVALNLDVNLNFNDPNNDGKIRFFELYENFEKSALAIFDVSATIEAKAYAYLDYFIGRKEWTLWQSGALEIFNTEKDETPTLATKQDGDVVVNVGDYASKRNIGDLSDGADTVTVTVTGTNKIRVSYGGHDQDYTITAGNSLIINSGAGADSVTVNCDSGKIANFNIQINGGEGDDSINLSGVTFATGYYAILTGGAGNDTIIGSAGRDYIFGDEGYVVFKEDEKTVKTVEAYVDSGVAGNDQIFAGADKDVVLGGGGHDFISGDAGEDILFGDGGRVEYDAAGTATASRSNLFDEGGNDTIYGGADGDKIYAGAGNDNVDAGSGNDVVNGDKGVDVVYGGSGDDTIDGGDGVDVLFGDTPATALLLAENGTINGVLPWAYVSSDLKKGESRLLNGNQIKLFDFDENYAENYLNALSADDRNDLLEKLNAKYSEAGNYSELKNYSLEEFFVYDLNQNFVASESVTENDNDKITGGLGSDIIFGDAGLNNATGGNDVLSGGVGNDFIDGDGGNDQIAGETGEDILYGGQGDDTLDGGTGDDFVFGDDGWDGYASARTAVGTDLTGLYSDNPASSDEQKNVFGAGMAAFAKNFRIQSNAVAKTEGGNDVIAAGQGSDFVDGQFGNDTYNVKFFGEYNLGYTNVMDSGTDAADSMTVYGTSDADELLIRASDAGLGFVALLPDSDPDTDAGEGKTRIERVNFWSDASRAGSGMDQMTVNAGLGDDEIAIDSTLSSITVNGEGGDDSITVGQLYHSARGTDATSANLASLDAFGIKNPDTFGTTETTQGFLSDGVNHASSITGGTGNDTITVLHTSAALSLSGNSGDDTFNIFSFVDTDLNPIMNGPMLVNGGAGDDSLSIVGSEGDDTFVYTTEGVSATGVSVQSINVEHDSAYGAEGDDSFYLLSSTEDQHVYLNGGLGNDSFYNGGVQTDANYIEVENADYRGHSGQIDHTVTASGTTDYASGAATSISVNIVDDDDVNTVEVVFTNAAGEIADPSPVIEEGTEKIAYYVALSKAPAVGETVEVTVFAPGVSDGDLQRGDRGIQLAKTGDTTWGSYVTLTFTASNWNVSQAVRVIAPSDLLREGNMTVGLLHSTKVVPASGATTANTKVGLCRNTLLSVMDKTTAMSATIDDVTEVSTVDAFAITTKVFLTSAQVAAKQLVLGLNALPETASIRAWLAGSSTALDVSSLVGNELTVTLPDGLETGSIVYVHYSSSVLVVENQSTVTLAYEMSNRPVLGLAVVMEEATETTATTYSYYNVSSKENRSATDAYYYVIDGTQLVLFNSVSGKPQSVTGVLAFAGHSLVTPPDEAIPLDITSDAKVLIEPTNGSTDVAETKNAAGESVYTDAYTITLNGAVLTGTQSVTVNINAVSTPYATMDGSRGEATQVEVYKIVFVAADGTETVITDNLISVTFSATSWGTNAEGKTVCGRFYVYVRAVDDSVAESDALSVIPVGESTIANIKGTIHEDGAGENGPELPEEPKLLHYGVVTSDQEHEYTVLSAGLLTAGTPVVSYETLSVVATATGTSSSQSVYSFVSETSPDAEGNVLRTYQYEVTERSTVKDSTTVTVKKTTYTLVRQETCRDELNGYADDFAATVSGKTITFAASALTQDQIALLVAHNTIVATVGAEEGEVCEIDTVSGPDSNGNYVVTLKEAFAADASFRCTVGVARPSLFVNEEECTDRIFVNNQDNSSEATDALNTLSSAVAANITGTTPASESDLLLGKNLNALRFTHSDLAESGLNFANMDYAELNLGTGKDTFAANAAVSRADAFQTFTVVNTGNGDDVDANEVPIPDDTITVGSYKSMTGTQIAEGKLAYSGSITTADFEEQYTYTLSSLTEVETALLNTNLTGWFVEITDASGATERREIVGGSLAVGATITLARKFTMAITAGTSFRIVGQVISSGTVQTPVVTDLTAPTTVSSMTLSSVWARAEMNIQMGDVLVLYQVITAANGSTSYGEASRHVITAVSGNIVTFDGAVDGNGRSYTYRVETKLSDDQLVINAQAGNDTITATGDGITREGLIVFGGNGADTITVDNSAYVFGDRGQVIYTDASGKMVTRLGSTGTDVNAVDNSDYATESERDTGTIQSVPAYLQTDGVRREATYFQTMNNEANSETGAQSDTITINGDNNIVFGGNDGDSIQIDGSTNVALGDGGRLDFDLVTDANDAAQYGDEVKRYLHYVRTVDDPQGGADTINTGDGDNILFGGAVNDTLTSRSGDDIIVGDGGELELDESRNPVRVSNEGRLVGGADYISAGTGLNTVFGGVDDDTIITGVNMQSTSTDLREAFSNDTDVVLGDNGYRTFQGTATDVETTGILSFNFQGNASTGLAGTATAGATDYASSHWNNVAGSVAGTYGNDDDEVVTLASGERITGVTLSYGGFEDNRVTSTDSTIQLQAYTQSLNVTGADATLMSSGLLTTAPNNQSNNKLGVEVDGLKQHFSTYDVIVYLDAPDNHSDLDGTSVRKVTIYQNGEVYDYFYLNDASGSKYSGSYIQATAKTAAAALITTSGTTAYANYVVFTGLTGDNFRVEITDGVTNEALNGLDLPSIAGIQVKGTYYPQDKVASSDDALGGNDSISTGGGDDIVIGGIGNDVMATFGDVRYGESDADIVFGDNASITLMDRNGDGIEEVTHTISTGYAETSADLSFNDTIVTGNGNDTVVGGDGTDRILTQSQDELAADILADSGDLGVTIAPFALTEEVLTSLQSWDTEDLTVFSINLTSRNADSDSVVRGRAGVVADENWNNICLYNGRFYVYGSDYNSTTAPMNLTYTEDGEETSTTSVGVSILAYDTTDTNTSNRNNSSITEEYHDELDSDSENSKLFNSYLQAQSQQRIQLTLTNLNSVVGNNSYDVYVYLDIENSSTDTYNYIYQIFSASNGSYAGETYYLNDWTGNNFNGEFREVTASSANTNVSNGITPSVEMIGNYVVFHNVTGSTFNVFLQNYHTGSGQWPKNMPAITGVQVVVNNTQNANGTEKALPANGDYDKDVVIGDNGKVNFALDIPYGVDEVATDYKNKVITADSMATSFTGSTVAADSNDFITTGRNQDTIIGGNGSDAIDSGAGDDVVVGDNANIEMADYNAIGVRMPSTEIILDQLTINTSNNEAYIGMSNTTASTFTTKWNAGGVPGVTLTASDLSGNDIIDAGLDNDFVIGGAGKDVLIANEGQTDVLISESQDTVIDSESYATKDAYLADLTAVLAKLDANDQGILNSFVNNDFDPYLLPTLGSILTETYEEPEGPSGGTVSGTYTLTAYQSQSITLAAGETVELVSSANFGGNQWWTPNVVLQVNASSATTLGWSWMDNGATQSATTTASGYYVVNIADAPNEDGLYVIRLTAVTAGTISVAIGQG